jgi:hypothetical protein
LERRLIRSITIPRNAEIFCSSCFSNCKSLSFENESRLRRIELYTFHWSTLESIGIPRGV